MAEPLTTAELRETFILMHTRNHDSYMTGVPLADVRREYGDIFDRWLAALRAEWEAEGEHVFIERYGAHHAKFGGIGGDATSLTITREAWKSVGESDVLAVSWVPVEQGDES